MVDFRTAMVRQGEPPHQVRWDPTMLDAAYTSLLADFPTIECTNVFHPEFQKHAVDATRSNVEKDSPGKKAD